MKNLKRILLLVFCVGFVFACSEIVDEEYSEDLKSGHMGKDKDTQMVTMPFKADFTGVYTNVLLGPESECDEPYFCRVFVDFYGTATHLGNMHGSFEFCACGPEGIYASSKSYMVSANGDSLIVTVSGQVVDGRLDDHPEYVTSWWRDEFFILRGTGRFEGATGHGWTDDYNSSEDPNSHHRWSGVIKLPKAKKNK